MTLSSVFAALTGREADQPAPRPVAPAPDVLAALLSSEHLQFVPGSEGNYALGAQRDVRERIADVLPGVAFDEDGHGAFMRTGYSVAFDTGNDDRVQAVRVHVTGGAAAMPPLQRLATKTGWKLEAIG